RQARDVLLDERTQLLGCDGPSDQEREVTRVAEAVMKDGEDLVGPGKLRKVRRGGLHPGVAAREDLVERIVNRGWPVLVACDICPRLDRGGIQFRRRELQVHQLEHRLE